jgi:hypothetical protein
MARLEMRLEDFEPFFEYKDGQLIRKIDQKHKNKGRIAGSPDAKGYLKVTHKTKGYMVHRIVFLLHHGYCPDFVDHIDNDHTNNRIENLRPADITTNHYNCKIPSNNKTGIKGVHKLKRQKGYQAVISYDKKKVYLGTFSTLALAGEFVGLARDMLHGEFANHGLGA